MCGPTVFVLRPGGGEQQHWRTAESRCRLVRTPRTRDEINDSSAARRLPAGKPFHRGAAPPQQIDPEFVAPAPRRFFALEFTLVADACGSGERSCRWSFTSRLRPPT